MNYKFLILHGVQGQAGKHWMQPLHDELEKRNVEVIMPTLPNSMNPSYSDWIDYIKEIFSKFTDEDLKNLVVIAHSMGVPAALEIIQNLKTPIRALYSVSGFHRDYGSDLNTKFMKDINIDLSKAKNNIENAFVLYGDNDPYVPQEILNQLAEGLEVEPIVLKNGGHLNTDSGYGTFPLLLNKILEII